MSKGMRRAAVAGGVIAVLVLVGFIAFTRFTRAAIPRVSGNVQAEGLSAPVEIVRDEYGVPHIYAQTPEDLYFAQGYVHAQERFWQMEFQRHTGHGRLSEIFGESTLATDRYLRHFGFSDLAQQSYEMADDRTKLALESYAAGVNAYISQREPAQLGLEFALLGLQGVTWEIEPWTPADSLIWGQMMIYDQSDKLGTELRNLDRIYAVGVEMADDLRPPYRDDRPVIVPSEELGYVSGEAAVGFNPDTVYTAAERDYLLGISRIAADGGTIPAYLLDLGYGTSIAGSNSFAVSGDLTATGMPLLANDPHMSVNTPNLWFEVGLHCAELSDDCLQNMRGFSLPGVPGLLIGHNDHIAWGLTNANYDAEDVFIERINPENPNQYEYQGEWEDMTVRTETIIVRGRPEPYEFQVRFTRHGLVATDYMFSGRNGLAVSEDGPGYYALAYSWTALEPIRSVEAIMGVNVAQNYDEFRAALSKFDAGKQTFIYADVEGNIGLQVPGKVPIRAAGDGSLPVPGWTGEYDWVGFIPYDDLPRAYNPAQGYIATANHAPVRPADYPYLWDTSFDYGQRGQRINELISGDPDGITVEDMIAIQTDTYSISAMEILPYLEGLTFDDPAVSAARDRLESWDGQMAMDSPEAAIFNLFWDKLVEMVFFDQLNTAGLPEGKHDTSDTVYWLLQDPANPWWDNINSAGVETADDILAAAFEAGYAEGLEELGEEVDDWQWGDLHTITFQNATLGSSGIGLIEDIFNRGPFPTAGSESVVQKTCWDAGKSYAVDCIPALRQVIDLGELSNSRMIHSLGQSGHPYHRQYDHFIDDWRFFRYHPNNWTREDAESGRSTTLTLVPAGG
jgi:penicillin amidase